MFRVKYFLKGRQKMNFPFVNDDDDDGYEIFSDDVTIETFCLSYILVVTL